MELVPRADDVDPDIRDYLDSPLSAFPDFATSSAAQVRAHFARMRAATEVPAVAEVVDTAFDGPGGSVAVRIYRSDGQATVPTILWFHGGGWVLGDLDTAELPARSLCAQTGCAVVSVGYRLAPETAFPGAFHDCLASLAWVRSQGHELGIDSERIVVGGDSAGGNLAAAVGVADRDSGGALLGQLLVYPVITPKSEPGGFGVVADGYGLTEEAIDWFWDQYVPDSAERGDWRVNLKNAELSETADAFVLTCGFDPLAAEGLDYAAQLQAAGVNVTTEHLPGAVHGVFAMNVDAGLRSRAAASAWVRSLIQNSSLEFS